LIYRKMEYSAGTEKEAPRDSTKASQQRPTEKSKPFHKTHHSKEEPPLQPDLLIIIPLEENLPQPGRSAAGANLITNPTHKERPTTENPKVLVTLLSNRYIPQVLETREEDKAGGATELDGVSAPPTEKADHRKNPLPEKDGPGQSENEYINLPQSILVFFHLSQGRIEELTSLLSDLSGTPLTMEMRCKWLGLEPQRKEIPHDSRNKKLIDRLSEDPEDHPAGFISIIERQCPPQKGSSPSRGNTGHNTTEMDRGHDP